MLNHTSKLTIISFPPKGWWLRGIATKAAFPGVLGTRLWKSISHIQVLVIYFIPNPTHQTRTGIANRWETTNSKPPGRIMTSGQSLRVVNQKQRAAVRSHLLHSSLLREVLTLYCALFLFTSLSNKQWESVGPKPFCWAKLSHVLTFTLATSNLQGGDILRTCGVAFIHSFIHSHCIQAWNFINIIM
jgi:hypothetical protein